MKVSEILNELFLKMAEISSPAEMGSRFEEILDKYGALQITTEESNEGKRPKEFTHVNYQLIPEHMRENMEGYLEYGWELGGFLYSILTNDLRGTVKRADVSNRYHLLGWIDFCLGELPGQSWGSPEAVAYWMRFREDHHGKKK